MNTPMILWKHWTHQVGELFPSMHGHQQKTLALLVQGIVMSGSVVLQRIAETLGIEEVIEAKMSSIERRLSRFLANPRIKVEVIWDTFIREILNNWPNQPMTFVLDMTPYRSEFTIVYLGLLVHSRVLPSSMGSDARSGEMGRKTVEHRGTIVRPGTKWSEQRGELHADRRSWTLRYALSQIVPGPPMALSPAYSSWTYVSWKIGKRME